jgi:hypothetical protein
MWARRSFNMARFAKIRFNGTGCVPGDKLRISYKHDNKDLAVSVTFPKIIENIQGPTPDTDIAAYVERGIDIIAKTPKISCGSNTNVITVVLNKVAISSYTI